MEIYNLRIALTFAFIMQKDVVVKVLNANFITEFLVFQNALLLINLGIFLVDLDMLSCEMIYQVNKKIYIKYQLIIFLNKWFLKRNWNS
jgi:hypothetical protein